MYAHVHTHTFNVSSKVGPNFAMRQGPIKRMLVETQIHMHVCTLTCYNNLPLLYTLFISPSFSSTCLLYETELCMPVEYPCMPVHAHMQYSL